jgi:hypothetical protein
MIKRIISGGQNGADRAALDFAIKMNLPHGGWLPKGRMAEDCPIPDRYNLKEMRTRNFPKRTERTIIDSDGTLIATHGKLTDGSKLTKQFAENQKKPYLHVDLNETSVFEAAEQIIEWVLEDRIGVLNVAGSRASKDPKIYKAVYELLETVYYMAISKENVVAIRGAVMPKTVNDAVKRLIASMPLKFKVNLSKMDEGELINLHFTFGAFIRNQFGLWSGNEDLLNDCRQVSGITFLNPDDAAAFIIGELWESLKKTHQLRVVN